MNGTWLRWFLVLCGFAVLSGCGSPAILADNAARPPVPVPADKQTGTVWRFVVFGDTRDVARRTDTGVSPQLGRMAQAIAAENPVLVIHLGDLVNGYYTTEDSKVHKQYSEQFANWKTAVKPIYDFEAGTGIPLYVIRGNHEDGGPFTDSDLKEAYRQSVGRFMPQNGPENEKGLTYSIAHRQAVFIGLDEYSIKELGVFRGLIDQPWLDAELSLLPRHRFPYLFVFGHQPAYQVAPWSKGPFPDLYEFSYQRDAFWKSLEVAGASIYFCGHVHFYNRAAKGNVQQVLIGNGGANTVAFEPREMDPALSLKYPPARVEAKDVLPGYLVFTVDEATQTVAAVQKLWNGAAWETGDSFFVQGGAAMASRSSAPQ